MPKPQGYAFESFEPIGNLTTILRDGGIKAPIKGREWDTFTCNHCQRVVRYRKRAEAYEMGGHCMVCDKMICAECVGKGCKPFEEKIRAQETRAALRREYDRSR